MNDYIAKNLIQKWLSDCDAIKLFSTHKSIANYITQYVFRGIYENPPSNKNITGVVISDESDFEFYTTIFPNLVSIKSNKLDYIWFQYLGNIKYLDLCAIDLARFDEILLTHYLPQSIDTFKVSTIDLITDVIMNLPCLKSLYITRCYINTIESLLKHQTLKFITIDSISILHTLITIKIIKIPQNINTFTLVNSTLAVNFQYSRETVVNIAPMDWKN